MKSVKTNKVLIFSQVPEPTAVYRHEVPGNIRKIKRLRYDGMYDTSHASTCRAISFWACAKSQAVLAYLVLQLLFAAEPGRRKTRCASVPYHCGQPLAVLFHTLFPTQMCRGAQPPAPSPLPTPVYIICTLPVVDLPPPCTCTSHLLCAVA